MDLVALVIQDNKATDVRVANGMEEVDELLDDNVVAVLIIDRNADVLTNIAILIRIMERDAVVVVFKIEAVNIKHLR
jgi:hypothetical protein